MVHAHFDDGNFRFFRHMQNRKRHADMIVMITGSRVSTEFRSKHMCRHILDSRLAAAAGHADNPQAVLLICPDTAFRKITISIARCNQIRHPRILRRLLGKNAEHSALFRRLFCIRIAVEILAFQRNKTVSLLDRAGIRAEAGDLRRRIRAVHKRCMNAVSDLAERHPHMHILLQQRHIKPPLPAR